MVCHPFSSTRCGAVNGVENISLRANSVPGGSCAASHRCCVCCLNNGKRETSREHAFGSDVWLAGAAGGLVGKAQGDNTASGNGVTRRLRWSKRASVLCVAKSFAPCLQEHRKRCACVTTPATTSQSSTFPRAKSSHF